MRRRRRQHLLAVCVLMVVAGGFLKSTVTHHPAERRLSGRGLLHVTLQVSTDRLKDLHFYSRFRVNIPSVILAGQHWNPGLHPRLDLFCHCLYLQVPCSLQSRKWQRATQLHVHVLTAFPKVFPEIHLFWGDDIYFFSVLSTEDRCWPGPTCSQDCCAHCLVPSTLLPYSSTTLGLGFFWKSCRGYSQRSAVSLWIFSYPFIAQCDF